MNFLTYALDVIVFFIASRALLLAVLKSRYLYKKRLPEESNKLNSNQYAHLKNKLNKEVKTSIIWLIIFATLCIYRIFTIINISGLFVATGCLIGCLLGMFYGFVRAGESEYDWMCLFRERVSLTRCFSYDSSKKTVDSDFERKLRYYAEKNKASKADTSNEITASPEIIIPSEKSMCPGTSVPADKNLEIANKREELKQLEEAINKAEESLAQAKRDLGDSTPEDAYTMFKNGIITTEQRDAFLSSIQTLRIMIDSYPGIIRTMKENRTNLIHEIRQIK